MFINAISAGRILEFLPILLGGKGRFREYEEYIVIVKWERLTMTNLRIALLVMIIALTVYGLLTVDKAMRQYISTRTGQIENIIGK